VSTPIKTLNPLEIFLMLFVKLGLTTPYDLVSRIDVGVGASRPALRRLEESKFVTLTLGPRNRMQFALTDVGEKQLRKALDVGSKQYWRHGRRDTFDSLRRAMLLAWASSRPEEAYRCIDQAREDLRVLAGRNELAAVDLRRAALRLRDKMLKNQEPMDESLLTTTVYQWIGAEMDAAEFKLQAETLHVLDRLVGELPPAPEIWPDTRSDQQALPKHRRAKTISNERAEKVEDTNAEARRD
jgi:DNA-binding PadR family transcriptional regulator